MTVSDFYTSINKKQGEPLSSLYRRQYNNFVFENLFLPRMSVSPKLELNKKDKDLILKFATEKAKAKEKEWRGVDDQKRIKREMTGAAVEYGLLKYYGDEQFFDNSIVEHSSFKNHPDLLPHSVLCDIKGASINNVPLVFKKTRSYECKTEPYIGKRYHCPNIIGITDNDTVWLLGIASVDVLKYCVDDNLMMIAENDTKTGFYGALELVDLPKEWKELAHITAVMSRPA